MQNLINAPPPPIFSLLKPIISSMAIGPLCSSPIIMNVQADIISANHEAQTSAVV